ncbi:hypothetical protein BGW38_001962 [Lunasporangiospora selenospora]|uniref:Ricin B lectin domain-containing protein n=1 Tax=Lunasporangiospora selenospora TaxID=979761 RepID=A0A9P6G1U8_9FUNG|nr:hypothetical protein BGW38_001962 [Lunasporangiospora selenospora]
MTRFTVLSIAILAIIAQVCTAFLPSEGVYKIELNGRLLTSAERRADKFVYALPDNDEETQLWQVYRKNNDFTIRNKKSFRYLGYTMAPDKPLKTSFVPYLWRLSQTDEKEYIIETSHQYDGESLVVDIAYDEDYPVAIVAVPGKSQDQAWTFTWVDDISVQPQQYRLPYKKAGYCHF